MPIDYAKHQTKKQPTRRKNNRVSLALVLLILAAGGLFLHKFKHKPTLPQPAVTQTAKANKTQQQTKNDSQYDFYTLLPQQTGPDGAKK